MPNNDRIIFRYNQPVILRILDPDPDCKQFDQETAQGYYQTTDGRPFVLPRPAVIRLLELDPAPGEEIGIVKQEGQRGTPTWNLWLTASTEQARAAAESAQESTEAPSDEELLLEASLKRETARKRQNGRPVPIRKEVQPETKPFQPRLFDRGTGTDGPAPAVLPQVAAIRQAVAHPKTPYPLMLLHIVKSVEWALKEGGIQLGDGPKQDLYSTIYIDAAKRSAIEYDFSRKVGE